MNGTPRTWLATAIQNALRPSPKPRPIDLTDVQVLAKRAQAVNEAALEHISNLPATPTEQTYVAMQLMRASFDHGRGLLHLLHSNPQDMAGPALALHRSQIENFLRSAYLGFLAPPEAFQDFLDNDEGVREEFEKGKWRVVGPQRLAKRVEALIHELSPPEIGDASLAVMIENAWSPLCGMVHGGKAVRALYQDGQGQIGCDISPDALIHVIGNCAAITNFGFLIVLLKVYERTEIDKSDPFAKTLDEFIGLLKEQRERQKGIATQ